MATLEFGTATQVKRLHCCAAGFTSIRWYKDNVPYPWKLIDPAETYPDIEHNNQTLIFDHLNEYLDEATYTCDVSNGTQHISHTKKLEVQDAEFLDPPIWSFTPRCQDYKTLPGANVTFFCEFYVGQGDYNLVEFRKENKTGTYFIEELDNQTYSTYTTQRDKGAYQGVGLIISNVKKNTYGKYIAKAANGHGDVYVPLTLKYGDPNAEPQSPYLYILIIIGVIIIFILPLGLLIRYKFGLDIQLLWKYKIRKVDTDGKTYDVFISHIGSEKTVKFCKKLLEYLENKWGFKTCLVERDLLAGVATCDNIVESVKDSSCFLLVLTPDYIQVPPDNDQIVLESPEYVKETHWRPYEFQIALEESLKLQTRIVIIKLEKLPANINMDHMKTLKHVIGVTRCLKWEPNAGRKQDKFWKNLLFQLPTSSKWRPTLGQLVCAGLSVLQHKSADDEKPLNRQLSDERSR
uniref:Soluble interferon alpha/beta receptor OPG204 n=1 Tax=Saccoglossus kowalevskii TaxID=10224 RepID=A0ABM0LZL7_SACKO|nr:PREDICTED: interleukin-1 receptor-like 1-like [Saccoglossus kowalevskii]